MASIYQLKSRFQTMLRPLVRRLASAGVTPNQVTVAALCLSGLAGMALWTWPAAVWPLWLVPVVLFIRMALNAVDGMLAREYGLQSRLGALLNEIGDVLSDAALYLPFAAITGVPATLVVLFVVLAGVSELAGVAAAQVGAARRHDGPMGKSDRAFLFGAVALLLALGLRPGSWLSLLLLAALLLLVLTIVNRVRRSLASAGR